MGRPDFADTLRNGLESADFSPIETKDLPVAIPQVLQHCEKRKEDILLDSFSFSIMSRNLQLVWDNIEEICRMGLDVSGLYPIHLAIAYLMGSDQCCNVVSVLAFRSLFLKIKKHSVDDHGYTLLDSLMITILKPHARCKPGDVDLNHRHENRFLVEEISICGRWDADSDFL